MATNDELYSALAKADAAGDTAGAKMLADHIRSLSASPAAAMAPAPKLDPSVGGGTLQFGPLDTGIKTPEWLDRGLAGAGKAMSDLGQGVSQYLPGGATRADIAETRRIDAPLSNTTAGKVGNVLGGVAMAAPTALIPGANTLTGAGVIGSLAGLLQPSTSTSETLSNAGMGVVGGVGGQFLGQKLAQAIGSKFGASNAAADLANALKQPKADTLAAGQAAGYVIPPSAVNPSWMNKRLESIAGKAAVGQEAAVRNQEVTNALARKAVGLADDVPVTEGALAGIRKAAGKPYQEVGSLSSIAAQDLEALKAARFDANAQYKFYNRTGDPAVLAKAQEAKKLSDLLDQSLSSEATAAGRPELVNQLSDARKQIAKTYDVGRTLNVGDASVSAPVIGRLLDKGRPLSEELKTIGQMQQAFAPYLREGASIPTPGVSKSEALASALLATAGSATSGPIGLAAGALPLLSGPVRSMLLSKPYQSLMANIPQQTTGRSLQLAQALAKNKLLQGSIPALSAQGVLSAAPMLQEN